MDQVRLVALSDTHKQHEGVKMPEGDIAIHCGDMSPRGGLEDVVDFLSWYSQVPCRHKVLVAGNHDWLFERDPELGYKLCEDHGIIYLCDDAKEICGLNFYGTPWQPEFCNWAFNLPRGGFEIKEKWDKIPLDTDLLITHGPPASMLDKAWPYSKEELGCEDMLYRVLKVKPLAHFFGHIHGSSGMMKEYGVTFVNASVLNEEYKMRFKPRVLNVIEVDGVKEVVPWD